MKIGIASAEHIRSDPGLRLNPSSYLCPNTRLKARIRRLRKAEASAREGAESLENELMVRQMAEAADIAAGRLIMISRGEP